MNPKTKIIIYIVSILIFLCIGVISVSLALSNSDNCIDHEQGFFNINIYLLVTGSGYIFFSMYELIMLYVLKIKKSISKILTGVMTFFYVVFIMYVISVGPTIVGSNKNCLLDKSVNTICAVINLSIAVIYYSIIYAITNLSTLRSNFDNNVYVRL